MPLSNVVPAARLARYAQVAGPDPAAVERFYRWSQALSLGVFADIATVEVAMRSAMARELCGHLGLRWYRQDGIFDDDATRSLSTAWRQGGLGDLRAPDEVIEGKLVASLMFGFWVKLLGVGSYAGKTPQRHRRYYSETLWGPALSRAFPGSPGRQRTQRAAYAIQAARNRIAHHEHIAWGIPLAGQPTRLAVSQVRDTLLDLAGWIEPDLRAWMSAHSTVNELVASCPVDPGDLRLTPSDDAPQRRSRQ
jgi:hypothetical protein